MMTHNQLARLNQAMDLLRELREELDVEAQQLNPEITEGDLIEGATYEIARIGVDYSPSHVVGQRVICSNDPLFGGDCIRTDFDSRCGDGANNPCWYVASVSGNGTWVTGVRLVKLP